MIRAFAAVLLVWLLGFAWFALLLPQPAPPRTTTDAVVALTGGGERIERALNVLQSRRAPRLLISGVDRDVRPEDLAQEYDRPLGLFRCCVDLGFQSVDTRSNALEVARWVRGAHVRSLRLVTSDWHMRRARLELSLVLPDGVRIVPDAVPTSPSLAVLFREYNKFWLRAAAALIGL